MYRVTAKIAESLNIEDAEAMERYIEAEIRSAAGEWINEQIDRDIRGEVRGEPPCGLIGAT